VKRELVVCLYSICLALNSVPNTAKMKRKEDTTGQRWRTPLIPAVGRQSQVHLCEFKASLVYRASSRTARATQRNPASNPTTAQKNKNKNKHTHTKNYEMLFLSKARTVDLLNTINPALHT